MFRKLLFRVRINLMKWDERSASGDVVVFTFLISQVIVLSISVLATIFILPWLLVVSSILYLVLVFLHLITGEYCQSMVRSMSELTARVKILAVIWCILFALWIILGIRLLATLV